MAHQCGNIAQINEIRAGPVVGTEAQHGAGGRAITGQQIGGQALRHLGTQGIGHKLQAAHAGLRNSASGHASPPDNAP